MIFTAALNRCAYYFSIACHRIGIGSSIVYTDPPSKVIDGIYIGSIATTDRQDQLNEVNIGTIINLSGLTVRGSTFVVDLYMDDAPITPKTLPAYVSEFSRGLEAITTARSAGYNVLVNCAAGINRSATLIGLWLIIAKRMTYFEAINAIETANRRRGLPALTNMSFRDFLLNAYVICHQQDIRRNRRRSLPGKIIIV